MMFLIRVTSLVIQSVELGLQNIINLPPYYKPPPPQKQEANHFIFHWVFGLKEKCLDPYILTVVDLTVVILTLNSYTNLNLDLNLN